MFSYFMVNTWAVASLVALVCGVVGFFVVVRGASFAAHALPLGAFPGAAAATLLGIDQFFGLITFAGLGVLSISQLGRRARLEVGTAMCLVMLLGMGALFLSMTHAYSQQVYALLFGEVLGVSPSDIKSIAIIGALSVIAVLAMFRPLLLNSISPELGDAQGFSRNTVEICFLSVLALASALALPVVGSLLVFSLLIGYSGRS